MPNQAVSCSLTASLGSWHPSLFAAKAHLNHSVSYVLWQTVSAECSAADATVRAEIRRFVFLVFLVCLAGGEELSVQHVVKPLLKLGLICWCCLACNTRSSETSTAGQNSQTPRLPHCRRVRGAKCVSCAGKTAGSSDRQPDGGARVTVIC